MWNHELRLFCAPIMGRFMIPTTLEVITKMPRTQTGKPAKEELKKDSSLTSEV